MEHPDAPRRFPDESLVPAALVGAALVALPPFFASTLVLVNASGPLPEHRGLAVLASLGIGVLAACLGYPVTRWLLVRPVRVLIPGLVAYGAAVLVMFPARVDEHESFVDQPDQRQACHGWSFSHYPPDTFDAASTSYCVGVETSLPPG